MDQEMVGVRQDVVAVQRHLAGMAEILNQLRGFRVHADIAEQPDLEHAREHVAGDRRTAALLGREQPVVLLGQRRQLLARDDIAGDQAEQDLAVELRQMGRHLGDEALRDRRRTARDLGTDRLARAAARVDRREVAADEHDVARPADGVADPERDHVLLVAGALVHDPGGVLPEEAHPRIPGVRVPRELRLRSTSMFLRMISIRSSRAYCRSSAEPASCKPSGLPRKVRWNTSLRIETKILTWLLIACRSRAASAMPTCAKCQ